MYPYHQRTSGHIVNKSVGIVTRTNGSYRLKFLYVVSKRVQLGAYLLAVFAEVGNLIVRTYCMGQLYRLWQYYERRTGYV